MQDVFHVLLQAVMPFGQGSFDLVEHFMHLIFGDDQRRAECQRVAQRAEDYAFCQARSMYSYVRLSIDRCTATYV